MATTFKQLLGNSNQTITITGGSLAANGQRSSAAIDDTTGLYSGANLVVYAQAPASALTASPVVNIYVYGSANNGTNYPEGCGTDTSVTLASTTNLISIRPLNTPVAGTVYYSNPLPISSIFTDGIPSKWGIVLENKASATIALGATCGAYFEGMLNQGV